MSTLFLPVTDCRPYLAGEPDTAGADVVNQDALCPRITASYFSSSNLFPHLSCEADAAGVGVIHEDALGAVARVVGVVALRRHVASRAHDKCREHVENRVACGVQPVPEGQSRFTHCDAGGRRDPDVRRLFSNECMST